MTKYRIYGKPNDKKKYQAYDAANGALVINLIYASLFDVEESVIKLVEELNTLNRGYHFKYKAVPNC